MYAIYKKSQSQHNFKEKWNQCLIKLQIPNLQVRKLTNKFNNSLIDLEIVIIKEIEKINNNERLEIKKMNTRSEKY